MASFVTADARVVSRGREPVDVHLCGPTAGYYLRPASGCVLHDLPGFVDVVPVQWIRLPEDTKRVCDVWILLRELHIAGALWRRLRDWNSVPQHGGDSTDLRSPLGHARSGKNVWGPVGSGVLVRELHRPETLVSRAGNSVDSPNQRLGGTLVELPICILKHRGFKVVPARWVLRHQRVPPEHLTQGLQIERMAFEPGFPRHNPNLTTAHEYRRRHRRQPGMPHRTVAPLTRMSGSPGGLPLLRCQVTAAQGGRSAYAPARPCSPSFRLSAWPLWAGAATRAAAKAPNTARRCLDSTTDLRQRPASTTWARVRIEGRRAQPRHIVDHLQLQF